MKNLFVAVLLTLSSQLIFSQITGTILDSIEKKPIQYVNIWIKNKALGGTSGHNGKFSMDKAKVGDTLMISYMGYESREVLAGEEHLTIYLKESAEELGEVVIIPMKLELEKEINSYERRGQIQEFLYAGENLQYSAARFFEHKSGYEKTPFIKEISVVTDNTLKDPVPLSIKIIAADPDGRPSETYLSGNFIIETKKGRKESTLDLTQEKVQVPENGFFIVLERIYQEEYRHMNRYYEEGKTTKYVYQPNLGMTKEGDGDLLWWYYGGSWKSPEDLKRIMSFPMKDLAVNVVLSN